MGKSKRALARRTQCAVFFCLLLLSTSAIPVFAADPPTEPAGEEFVPAHVGSEDIAAGIAQVEKEVTELEKELATPAAAEERSESREAFGDVSASESEELLSALFGEELERLNEDPARALSDAEIVSASGDNRSATISREGDEQVVESTFPIRIENEEGDVSKLDLSLEPTSEGFRPENPLTDVSLPSSAGEEIVIGDEGLSIAAPGAADSEAHPFDDKSVFYPEVYTDTDRLVAPTSYGVEIFDMLRSVESPESLRYELTLPEGASLHSEDGETAEVTREGETLARVLPPRAVDAQGTEVPVELHVEGSSVVLQIAHREEDVAYPILVDPAVWEDYQNASWYNGYNLNALTPGIWDYNTSYGPYIHGSTSCIYRCWGGSNRGLFVSTENGWYPANTWGRWIYAARNADTFIAGASLSPFWRDNHGCPKSTYQQPDDYEGLYETNHWNVLRYNDANEFGWSNLQGWGRELHVGLTMAGQKVEIPCWRDIMVGGALIYLDDWGNPSVDSVTGIPSGWVSDTSPFAITVNAGDKGLGVQNVYIRGKGNGLIPYAPTDCPGTKLYPCPTYRNAAFNLTGDSFDEGEKEATASALDPLKKGSNTVSFTMRVDRTPPEVTLGGQLAVVTEEDKGDLQDPEKWDPLSLPVYNLRIEATDGSLPSPANRRSGVKSVEVFLDSKGTPEQSWTQSCPGSSCSMTQTYALKLNSLSAGKHTLKVKVYDQVGKLRERKIEFEFFPATGLDDDYVMQRFPLPDGHSNPDEEEHPSGPELAVNVMNGNLGYHERDVDVEGVGANLTVERDFNSISAATESTEWGVGWDLAETPALKTEEAEGGGGLLGNLTGGGGGLLGSSFKLPTQVGEHRFDAKLQAVLTKEAGGGLEIADQSGKTDAALAFDASGKVDELRTAGPAGVDYNYEGGDLSKISVDDPASTGLLPGEVEVGEIGERSETPTFAGSFKYETILGDSFSHPGDVAVDSQERIWVADQNKKRVLRFNASGQYQGALSQFPLYSLQRPAALASDSAGNLWVLDAAANRVEKFNSNGEYLAKFGSSGSGNGQFSEPEGIAVDGKGNIWVSDTNNGRIEKFNSSGTFLKAIGSKGSGSGQLGEPTGIDVGIDGNVFVADWLNNRVSVFNEAGEFVRQFGSNGTGNGQFKQPHGIEVDNEGRVWVSDQGNSRIQEFDEDGNYLAQFGSNGTGNGQFKLSTPSGVATNTSANSIWIADTDNNRIQKFSIPQPKDPLYYATQLGSTGTGNGQLNRPQSVALNAQGNAWVADTTNNRIERFNSKGEYLAKFGSSGSGNGQLNHPTSLAIDAKGNIWVVDSGNWRVQKFNSNGEYLSKFGSQGTGNGQFSGPDGIAIDAKGNIWVSDTPNSRIEKFSESGTFLKAVGSKGSASGQLNEPSGLDVGPGGNVWVADTKNNRVEVFNELGEYIGKFGAAGEGNGQFNQPEAVAIDSRGSVWVADQTGRVQQFAQFTRYIGQFGSKGSGPEQFNFGSAAGIAADAQGSIWVADTMNDRVDRWHVVREVPSSSGPEVQDDPEVDIDVSGGLVESVEGDEAGEHSYTHEGSRLTSHDGPQGKTAYEYDSANRLTHVTLPNGTTGAITYNATYGRVSSVTVDPAGSAPSKTTYFTFQDEPRRTTVTPPDAPVITYDIGADGSVLKWWNSASPPVFDDMAGTLYASRETSEPIATGIDYNLVTQAHSEEGISSILVIANGNQVVDERTCEQDYETPGTECVTLVNEWITNTGNWPPGILNLEVVITDRTGDQASERFWVNIPYTPPPQPGVPLPPKFEEIAHFREEFGLDLDLKDNELLIDDRIFDLIGAWYNPQTPEGEVARATQERWGVPLRAVDAAELEYREGYIEHNASVIEEWAQANPTLGYAGYYVDHRAGGKFYVGFTSNQSQVFSQLKAAVPLAAADRVYTFPTQPAHALGELASVQSLIATTTARQGQLAGLVSRIGLDARSNGLTVGAGNVSLVNSVLHEQYPGIPFEVYSEAPAEFASRYTDEGPIRAGQFIGWWRKGSEGEGPAGCTAGFGAAEKIGTLPSGQPKVARFVLTAGHCFSSGFVVNRFHSVADEHPDPIGVVTRRSSSKVQAGFQTDAEAVQLEGSGDLVPRTIYRSETEAPIKVTGVAKAHVGLPVCVSGAATNVVRCGPIDKIEVVPTVTKDPEAGPFWMIHANLPVEHGDSGGPMWLAGSGKAVGLMSTTYRTSTPLITPQLPPDIPGDGYPPATADQVPGALSAPGMGSNLYLMKADG